MFKKFKLVHNWKKPHKWKQQKNTNEFTVIKLYKNPQEILYLMMKHWMPYH